MNIATGVIVSFVWTGRHDVRVVRMTYKGWIDFEDLRISSGGVCSLY